MTSSYEALSPYISHAMGLPQAELASAFRPATGADLPGILALRRAVIKDVWWDDEPFMQWRYFDLKTRTGTTPYWVFAKGGQIIGSCGLEPVVLVIDGKPVDAVRSMDIMVRPDLDGLGLGAFMNLALFKHFPIIVVSGSNERSHQLLTRLFHHTGNLRVWKTVIASRELIENRFKVGRLTRVVAASTDLVLALGRRRRRMKRVKGVVIQELTSFDRQVTELSGRREVPGRIMVRRSSEYLNWRFTRNPRCRYRVFGAFIGERLEGYVVTRLNLARPNPRREGEIVDWLVAAGPDDVLLTALIQAGVDSLMTVGAQLVTCAATDNDVDRAMKANGFQLRAGEGLPFFVRASEPAVHSRLSSTQGWFLTRADFDVE